MIQFYAGNTHFKEISQSEIHKITQALIGKREDLGFIDVDITTDLQTIQDYVDQVSGDFESIVILGIGGSALGTKALLEGLYGKYYNEIKHKKGKNIYVLDNIDPETFHDVEQVLEISKTLFVCISKSGGTIETLSEYLYYRGKVQEVSSHWKKHFCFIVGENCSMKEKLEEDFQMFYIPENIGGRFSVFTAVGLLPLAFSGVDISLFLQSISEIKQKLLSQNISENVALELALTQFHYYENHHKNITVFFPYSSRMFQIGEWYKQLMGESIGKAKKGITLTSSLGVTDQHSQLQLYQDGPEDKLFLTVGIKSTQDITIDSRISGYTFEKLLHIERYGTETSLKNEGHPLCHLSLERLDASHIAELLYILMFQIAYLGELFEIDAFDQPGVEKSKIITKQKLQEEFGEIDIFSKAFYE